MTELRISEQTASQALNWLTLIRAACITLSERPAYIAETVRLSRRFLDVHGAERLHLATIAARLAEEYGVRAETEDDGAFIRVVLSRREGGREPDAS